MAKELSNNVIPQQQQGSKTDDGAIVKFDNVDEAKELFIEAKKRLFDVNNWHHFAGSVSATFRLTDSDGNEITGTPKAGQYFKIDLPGPGTLTGEGFDWVKIETVEERQHESGVDELVAIRVRPASNPTNSKNDVAHFFTDEATSSFIVRRNGNTVTAEVHGRNEKANTNAKALIDKTRNAVVASGAKSGLSSVQWSNLAKGLLGEKGNS